MTNDPTSDAGHGDRMRNDPIINDPTNNDFVVGDQGFTAAADELADEVDQHVDATDLIAADGPVASEPASGAHPSATDLGAPQHTATQASSASGSTALVEHKDRPGMIAQTPDELLANGGVTLQRPSGQASRTIMIGLTAVTLVAALGLLLRNVSADSPTSITPVSVAAPAGSIAPAAPPVDTVVAPLNQVSFDPPGPEAGADLLAYQAELGEALRPVINVEYTDIVDDPAPWSSHLYGPADLPANLSAPVDETGQALCMVAQINLAELPALPTAQGNASTLQTLPKEGVLQFWLGLESPGAAGWTGGPTFAETADNPRQRVLYIAPSDVAVEPVSRTPISDRCANRPPAKGPAVALAMAFSIGWNVPETTDNRFDTALPQLAGALRSQPDEFYRAVGAINALIGPTPSAQLGGFNRLVNQDPRTVGVNLEDEARTAPITDLYEVLFEIHPSVGENDRWNVGFGNEGAGGWWADPKDVAALADPSGPTQGRSAVVKSAFWWDGQVAPIVEGEGG